MKGLNSVDLQPIPTKKKTILNACIMLICTLCFSLAIFCIPKSVGDVYGGTGTTYFKLPIYNESTSKWQDIVFKITVDDYYNGGYFYVGQLTDLLSKDSVSCLKNMGSQVGNKTFITSFNDTASRNLFRSFFSDLEYHHGSISVMYNGGATYSSWDTPSTSKDDTSVSKATVWHFSIKQSITNNADFDYLRKLVNLGYGFDDVTLETDINYNGAEWKPIGLLGVHDSANAISFTGNFDGKNHRIHNFKITAKRGADGGFALFDRIEPPYYRTYSTFKNLRVENATIQSFYESDRNLCNNFYGAVIASGAISTNFYDCYIADSCTVTSNYLKIFSTCSGMVASISDCTFTRCEVETKIKIETQIVNGVEIVGGIVANATKMFSFNNCLSKVTIEANNSTVNQDSIILIGGIIGSISSYDESRTPIIKKTMFNGKMNITRSARIVLVGGIAAVWRFGDIKDCVVNLSTSSCAVTKIDDTSDNTKQKLGVADFGVVTAGALISIEFTYQKKGVFGIATTDKAGTRYEIMRSSGVYFQTEKRDPDNKYTYSDNINVDFDISNNYYIGSTGSATVWGASRKSD